MTNDHISTKTLTVAEKAKIDRLEVDRELLPKADDTVDLGSATKEIKDAYIDGKAYVDDCDIENVRGLSLKTTTFTWDPASLADGAGETIVVTVTGAALGDLVLVAPPYDLQDMLLTAYVQAANTVEVRLQNESGAIVDLASGTWRVAVIRVA